MKTKHIIIAGGTGFLGNILAEHFVGLHHRVTVLTRGHDHKRNGIQYVHWNAEQIDEWVRVLEGSDALINMCGRTVDCRYTERNKKQIYDSRLKSTRVLGLALMKLNKPPKIWMNAASATIYRHAEDRPMNEDTGEYGMGFSVDVCQKWERMFFHLDLPSVRKVALRTTIVLGEKGSALQPLKVMAKLGVGGPQGGGNQMFSWIHAFDFCRAVEFVIQNNELEGPINIGAPNQVPNKEMMHTLRDAVDAPFGIPMPSWLLKIGAVVIGTEAELVLKSRWIEPRRLTQAGFQWEFPKLDKALADLCGKPMFDPEPKPTLAGLF